MSYIYCSLYTLYIMLTSSICVDSVVQETVTSLAYILHDYLFKVIAIS